MRVPQRLVPAWKRLRTTRNGLNVNSQSGVPRAIASRTDRLCRKIEAVVVFQHPVEVVLVCGDCVHNGSSNDREYGYGVYADWCKAIIIPCRLTDEELIFVLTHEVAHYEQDRDGRPMIERGVNVRARNIRKLAGLEID